MSENIVHHCLKCRQEKMIEMAPSFAPPSANVTWYQCMNLDCRATFRVLAVGSHGDHHEARMAIVAADKATMRP
jgi:hypothetical protein